MKGIKEVRMLQVKEIFLKFRNPSTCLTGRQAQGDKIKFFGEEI
jgi:hypothetical protein